GDVAMLLAAEQVSRAANLEIERRDAEAGAELGELLERRETLPCVLRDLRLRGHEEVGVGLSLRSTDAPAKLVELRQAMPIRAVDDHRVRARDVETVLDDGRRDEDVQFAGEERDHRVLE